jgi:hypothetical protein
MKYVINVHVFARSSAIFVAIKRFSQRRGPESEIQTNQLIGAAEVAQVTTGLTLYYFQRGIHPMIVYRHASSQR